MYRSVQTGNTASWTTACPQAVLSCNNRPTKSVQKEFPRNTDPNNKTCNLNSKALHLECKTTGELCSEANSHKCLFIWEILDSYDFRQFCYNMSWRVWFWVKILGLIVSFMNSDVQFLLRFGKFSAIISLSKFSAPFFSHDSNSI